MSVSTSFPSPKSGETPVCIVSSDKTGQFIFYPLPPGSYSVVSFYGYKKPVWDAMSKVIQQYSLQISLQYARN